jgi:indolepyruvate ferredoxin oxidoreductase beta subunit
VQQFSREHHVFDMNGVAKEAGTVVSAVMLGAIAGSGLFPFKREDYEAGGGKAGGKGPQGPACAASLARPSTSWPRARRRPTSSQVLERRKTATQCRPPPRSRGKPALLALSPQPVHEMFSSATPAARLPGPAYADLYAKRLRQVLAAERDADPRGANGYAITREMARWLALWMAFDDIVRVADLKSRASRWAARAGRSQGGRRRPAEGLRPLQARRAGVRRAAAAAARAASWWPGTAARRARQAPWALPLKIGTHSVFGMLALRTLASHEVAAPCAAAASRWSSR